MITGKSRSAYAGLSLLLVAALLSGCGGSSDSGSAVRSYDISITNLTANQPLSPVAVILHQSGYRAFVDGEAASVALERLSEGGDNSTLLTEARAHTAHLKSASGTQAIAPGATGTFPLSLDDGRAAHLSIVSMLVNTNDGFTGIDARNIASLGLNQSLTLNLPTWDSGTELNTEAAGTIPGPADAGGVGFNAARDDIVNFVGFHRGVVSKDDGLATSVLSESHRFDNPTARVTITRTR